MRTWPRLQNGKSIVIFVFSRVYLFFCWLVRDHSRLGGLGLKRSRFDVVEFLLLTLLHRLVRPFIDSQLNFPGLELELTLYCTICLREGKLSSFEALRAALRLESTPTIM